jgi:hypothetical protein
MLPEVSLAVWETHVMDRAADLVQTLGPHARIRP